MTQICLLDSNRLSNLLSDALLWNDAVSSLLVSATNGSILAYAFKLATPSIKDMRTQSTTISAAYRAAEEATLVFESQDSGAVSVIASVADHVLLAVNGAETNVGSTGHQRIYPPHGKASDDEVDDKSEEHDQHTTGHSEDGQDGALIRQDLESTSQDLAKILRDELAGMKWPDDI